MVNFWGELSLSEPTWAYDVSSVAITFGGQSLVYTIWPGGQTSSFLVWKTVDSMVHGSVLLFRWPIYFWWGTSPARSNICSFAVKSNSICCLADAEYIPKPFLGLQHAEGHTSSGLLPYPQLDMGRPLKIKRQFFLRISGIQIKGAEFRSQFCHQSMCCCQYLPIILADSADTISKTSRIWTKRNPFPLILDRNHGLVGDDTTYLEPTNHI